VTPHQAEYWDAHGTVLSYAKIAFGVLTGHRLEAGDNRKVAMR
jgi:hypothetical protein